GFWKNHPGDWFVTTLTMGGYAYDQAALLGLLDAPVAGDTSLILVKQLVAARLNEAQGADTSAVDTALADAEQWLVDNDDGNGLPFGSSDTGAVGIAATLEAWNVGDTGPGYCPETDAG
ncbi:MAG: hypothetical protein RLZZ299_102, partial [Pseudomonadota bacterium]